MLPETCKVPQMERICRPPYSMHEQEERDFEVGWVFNNNSNHGERRSDEYSKVSL